MRVLRACGWAAGGEAVDDFAQSLPLLRKVSLVIYQQGFVRFGVVGHRLLLQDHRFFRQAP